MAKIGEQPPKGGVSMGAYKEKSTSSEGWVLLKKGSTREDSVDS